MSKKFSKRVVTFSFLFLTIFTVVSIVYQFMSGNEISSTLIISVFSFFGTEMLALAGIKVVGKKENEEC